MRATARQIVESVETSIRRRSNQLSKYGTLDADDIVNLLDDARDYCELKGIDFDLCLQRHEVRQVARACEARE